MHKGGAHAQGQAHIAFWGLRGAFWSLNPEKVSDHCSMSSTCIIKFLLKYKLYIFIPKLHLQEIKLLLGRKNVAASFGKVRLLARRLARYRNPV